MEVEMKIRGLMMDPVTNMPIVVLKDVGSDTVLPIWVGVYEANAIALEIEKVTTPRPMTHDLIKNLLIGLDTHVHKIVVNELRDDTFFAVIWMEREGRIISIDSRPSDALALALRLDCPIYVEEEVLKTSKVASTSAERVSSDDLRKWLEGLNDEDLGRYKMKFAAISKLAASLIICVAITAFFECFLKNSYSAFTLPASTCKLLIAFPRPSVSCAMAASPFWFPVLMACRSLAMSAGAWARAWARWWSAVAERSSCISKRFWRRPRNESRRWSASGMT